MHDMLLKIIKDMGFEEDSDKQLSFDKIQKREDSNFNIAEFLKQDFITIAECKKASPSKGVIVKDYNPVNIALDYQACGAKAISVLTEKNYFLGSLEHLKEVKKKVTIPVLQKDFILQESQIIDGFIAGADLILLIVACLSQEKLESLYFLAKELKMLPLIEVHNQEELKRVLYLHPEMIGINNRDLHTFKVNLQVSYDLIKEIPKNIAVISESGIMNINEVRNLKKMGFKGVLMGESLLKNSNHHFRKEILNV